MQKGEWCKFNGCRSSGTHMGYCETHKCPKPQCTQQVSARQGRLRPCCEDHFCRIETGKCREPQRRATTEYCDSHGCRYKDCPKPIVATYDAARAQACKRHTCKLPTHEEQNYNNPKCMRVCLLGGSHCHKHTCKYTEGSENGRCPEHVDSGTEACTNHLCEVDFNFDPTFTCRYPKVSGSEFCQQHRCKWPGCRAQIDGVGWTTCKEHVCRNTSPPCLNPRGSQSPFCESCGCEALYNCPNPKLKIPGIEDNRWCRHHCCAYMPVDLRRRCKHQTTTTRYCVIHTCVWRSCSNAISEFYVPFCSKTCKEGFKKDQKEHKPRFFGLIGNIPADENTQREQIKHDNVKRRFNEKDGLTRVKSESAYQKWEDALDGSE